LDPRFLYLHSCFFFSSCGGHRDLLSFPTRRSSDLDARTGQPGAQLAVVPDGQHASTLGAWRGRAEVDGSVVLRDDLGADAPPGQDRKSTRLNSSHVKISYAVFCLKKKKKQAVPRRK